MGTSGLVPKIKDGDWVSVRQAIQKLSTKLGPVSTPVFSGIILTDLTASKLVATDADKKLVSSDLASWVAETANQVLVTDEGDGTITLSTPQDIHVSASPQFSIITATSKFKLGGGAYIEYDSESSNIPLHLQDAAGTSQVQIVDSNTAVVAYITSDGEFWSDIWNNDVNGIIYVDSSGYLTVDNDVFSWNSSLLDVAGAITASGIITGSNIIIGDAGNIGSATTPSAMQILSDGRTIILPIIDGAGSGLNVQATNVYDSVIFSFQRALTFLSEWKPPDVDVVPPHTCSNLDGCYGAAMLDTTDVLSNDNFTVTLATGLRAFIAATKGGSHTGNAIITSGCAFHVGNGATVGGAVITTQYGLYVSSLTAGASNYAIYTNAGPVRFGDNVEIADGKDIIFDTTTGTKIGTSATQKLAFFNTTPVIQNQLATGVGKTVDEVITELQRLGLVRQAA